MTLPSISPVIFFTLVTGLIWTFQTFTEAYVAGNTTSGQKDTLGEPQGSLLFYAIWLYQQGFRYFNMGYASALAWVLFGATMLCTLVLIKSSERWVHVEGNSVNAIAARQARAAQAPARERRAALHPDRRRHRLRLAVRVRDLHGADDARPGAHARDLARTRSASTTSTTCISEQPLLRWTWNTFLVSFLSSIGVVLSCAPPAYALARMRFRGRNAVFLLVLSTMMLPIQVTIIPLYVLFSHLGWIGSLKPLIIPGFFGDAFSIFLLRQFFMTIPERAHRRRARRRRERAATAAARGRAARQAGARRGLPVQLPLLLERPLRAAALRRRRPGVLHRVARPLGVPLLAPRRLRADDGRLRALHAARHDPLLPRPARVRRGGHGIVGLSNRLKNLPTTKAANSSPKLAADPHFAPFFKIFTNPKSEFNPLTPIGQQYGDTFLAFAPSGRPVR